MSPSVAVHLALSLAGVTDARVELRKSGPVVVHVLIATVAAGVEIGPIRRQLQDRVRAHRGQGYWVVWLQQSSA